MYKYFLGFRYLLSRPINLLGVGGVAVAVWSLITVMAIFSGFIREVRLHIRGASSDVILTGVEPDVPFPAVEALILETPHVSACAPRLILPSLLMDQRTSTIYATSRFAHMSFTVALGIDPRREMRATAFREFLTNPTIGLFGRVEDPDQPFRVPPAEGGFGKPQPGILLSSINARLNYRKGDRISLATVNLLADARDDFVLENYLVKRNLDIAGFYESRFHEHNQSTVYLHIDTARSMLGFDPRDENYREVFNEVAIKVSAEQHASQVRDLLGQSLIPLLGDPSDPFARKSWRVETWEQQRSTLLRAVDHERAMMSILLAICLVVAAFLIFATLSMMVTEKTRDIGILTALGATRAGILYVFIFCGMIIGMLGAILGTLAAYLSCLYLNPLDRFLDRHFGLELFPKEIYNLAEIPTELDLAWMLFVFLGAVLLALLFSLVPAYRASRFEPVRALRYE